MSLEIILSFWLRIKVRYFGGQDENAIFDKAFS